MWSTLRELCGLGPVGVRATRSIEEILALEADCVLYMQQGANFDDICRILAAGTNIVTTRPGTLTASSGDPTLKPFESNNLDLSLEWYFNPDNGGMAWVNFFRKDTVACPGGGGGRTGSSCGSSRSASSARCSTGISISSRE